MRCFVFVALATVAIGVPDMFWGRRREGFTSHLFENFELDLALLTSGDVGNTTITQKLDHFDANNRKTWKQRYFYNHKYATKDSTVNILYISGEQTATAKLVGDSSQASVYYAEQLNADLFALEHRFYGESWPTEDASVENLAFLSSRQAIEDIAEFIRKISEEKGGEQKWITVGGSYAGVLSAWSRLKHPELIAGSVASSAPLLTQFDFYGYLQTVDEQFKKHGGLCYDQIGDGIEKAQMLLQSAEGRETLTNLFRIRPALSTYDDLSPLDLDTFFNYLINPFKKAAQYSNPPIDKLCDRFTSGGEEADPLEAFKRLTPLTMDVSFADSLKQWSDVQFAGSGSMSTRLWIYQTCAELGYFQSTNRGSNVFGQTQSSNTYIEHCVQLFGIDADQIEKNVEATKEYYGGRDYYAGTNVVFSHGTQDPWSFLTKNGDPRHSSVVIAEVEGGFHCQDIGDSCFHANKTCTDNMMQIQTLTLENVRTWIDPVIPVPDRVEITDNVGKRPLDIDGFVSAPLQVNVNSHTSIKLRAKRVIETPESSGKNKFTKWNKFNGRRSLLRNTVPQDVQLDIENGWIEQTFDHFNQNEKRTFKQKWYSNKMFGSDDGPNFLMIGGQSPEDEYFLLSDSLPWMTYAKAVGANAFHLEHRYYGGSKLGTNDLQYLTSSQMLYDVATFIQTQKVQQNLTGPWITFGGSYSGSLAAWSREWFPELILGAVGSSGPVLAKTDFYEYLEVVEDVIKRQSQKCYERTADAFDTLHKLAQDPEGRATIQEKFVLSPAWTSDAIDSLDVDYFFYSMTELYKDIVQFNALDWSDVRNLCDPFENDALSSLDALSAVRMDTYLGYGSDPLSAAFDAEVQDYIKMKEFVDGHDETYSDEDLSDLLWLWQTCNEFGYYKSTDYGHGIFGTPVPVNIFIIMCERVFGVGMDDVEDGVARSNYQYGGRNRYNTTNVVLPNGDADPWHPLGIIEQGNLDESVVPILIKGTSHCADMYDARVNDPPELTQARKTILENIQKWLSTVPTHEPNTTNTVAGVSPTTSSSASLSSLLLPILIAVVLSVL